MKSLLSAGALAAACFFICTVSSRPMDVKRAVTTETIFVTRITANIYVFLDENGVPYSTTTQVLVSDSVSLPATPSTTLGIASTLVVPSSSVVDLPPITSKSKVPPISTIVTPNTPVATPPAPTPTLQSTILAPVSEISSVHPIPSPAPQPTPPPVKPIPPSPAPAPQAIKEDTSSNSLGIGITYDPFAGAQDQARCKDEKQINEEFSRMKDYEIVRIYGMGCNLIPIAMQNAVKNGQKLFAGAYLGTTSTSEDLITVVQTLKKAVDQYAGGSWDIVQLFSVENERVNANDMTAAAVVDAIHRARGQLRGLGYNGPVTAVETVPAMVNNPAICQNSDVVTVNCHAFFDPHTRAQDAGTFVKSQVEQVKKACGTKRVIVTESGWPHQGSPNGAAVPSLDNQRAALTSLRNHFNSDMFIFNAFDSTWKADWASSFNAERFWGVIQ